MEMGASSEEGGGPEPAKRPVGLFKSQLKSRRARGGRGLAGKAKAEAELETETEVETELEGDGNGEEKEAWTALDLRTFKQLAVPLSCV